MDYNLAVTLMSSNIFDHFGFVLLWTIINYIIIIMIVVLLIKYFNKKNK